MNTEGLENITLLSFYVFRIFKQLYGHLFAFYPIYFNFILHISSQLLIFQSFFDYENYTRVFSFFSSCTIRIFIVWIKLSHWKQSRLKERHLSIPLYVLVFLSICMPIVLHSLFLILNLFSLLIRLTPLFKGCWFNVLYDFMTKPWV